MNAKQSIQLACALSGISLLFATAGFAQSTPTESDSRLAQALKVPSKLEEISQMSKAGVGDPVILAYIKDSPTAYNLSAQDIIKLRDAGVSSEVTTALIQRGSEVRQANQPAPTRPATETVAVAPTYQTPPPTAVQNPNQTVYVVQQPVSTVSVHYFGAPSYSYTPSYYYPRYYPGSYVTFGSSYRCAPRASFNVGFGGHWGGYSRARYCR